MEPRKFTPLLSFALQNAKKSGSKIVISRGSNPSPDLFRHSLLNASVIRCQHHRCRSRLCGNAEDNRTPSLRPMPYAFQPYRAGLRCGRSTVSTGSCGEKMEVNTCVQGEKLVASQNVLAKSLGLVHGPA
jgi:hypothetical protein